MPRHWLTKASCAWPNGRVCKGKRGCNFAYVDEVLRTIVIDFVRERDAEKRGGGVTLLTMPHADASPGAWMEGTAAKAVRARIDLQYD